MKGCCVKSQLKEIYIVTFPCFCHHHTVIVPRFNAWSPGFLLFIIMHFSPTVIVSPGIMLIVIVDGIMCVPSVVLALVQLPGFCEAFVRPWHCIASWNAQPKMLTSENELKTKSGWQDHASFFPISDGLRFKSVPTGPTCKGEFKACKFLKKSNFQREVCQESQ